MNRLEREGGGAPPPWGRRDSEGSGERCMAGIERGEEGIQRGERCMAGIGGEREGSRGERCMAGIERGEGD